MAKTTPFDLIKPSTEFLNKEQAAARMEICHGCPRLSKGRCLECGCFMAVKTRLAKAECPLGKWGEQ